MFSDPKPSDISGWQCVYSTNTEIDAAMIANYLQSCDLQAQVLSKRDSAYKLTVGDMACVYVYVPVDMVEEAEAALQEWKSGEAALSESDEV